MASQGQKWWLSIFGGAAAATGVATLFVCQRRGRDPMVAAVGCGLVSLGLVLKLFGDRPPLREIVGDEWYGQLMTIKEVLAELDRKVFKHKSPVKECRHPLLVNASLLGRATQREVPATDARAGGAAEALRAMKFASAAYGCELLVALGMLPPGALAETAGGESHAENDLRRALAAHCGERDVRYFHPGGPGVPSHYVALLGDGSCVLGVRGTSNLNDALTDVAAKDESLFDDGSPCRAHGGILAAAKAIAAGPAFGHVVSARKVVVTGHSLGAGAAFLAALFLARDRRNLDVECFAFAPPPTVSACAVPRNLDCRTFVHDNDCVPTLSLRSVAVVLEALLAVDAAEIGAKERLRLLAAGDASECKAALAAARPKTSDLAEEFPHLAHVGPVFHLRDGALFKTQFPASIYLHPRMVLDHLQSHYEEALANAAKAERVVDDGAAPRRSCGP